MSATARLTAFGLVLIAVFGLAALAGGAIDPDRDESRVSHDEHAVADDAARHAGEPAAAHGDDEAGHGTGKPAAHPVRGLAVAENGLRLVVDDSELRRGRRETLRFRITDERGMTVRDFDVGHTKRMHVIVARRDLSTFQHLHPRQAADGGWSLPLRLDEAGAYRLFADFSHEKNATTLATDLRVDGAADLQPLPAVKPTSLTDGGYEVRLDSGRARPGKEAHLRFTITRDGHAVHTEPYLGAGGHLVALREGDLAFLHVHPTEHADGVTSGHDDSVGFAATFPTAGRYRLFLQFQHEGGLHTVAFTLEVK